MSEIKCDICNTKFEIPNYGDGACPSCGQKYEYEEGFTVIITPKQMELLREDYKEKAFDIMSESCTHVQKEGGDGYECNYPNDDEDPFCYKSRCPLLQ